MRRESRGRPVTGVLGEREVLLKKVLENLLEEHRLIRGHNEMMERPVQETDPSTSLDQSKPDGEGRGGDGALQRPDLAGQRCSVLLKTHLKGLSLLPYSNSSSTERLPPGTLVEFSSS